MSLITWLMVMNYDPIESLSKAEKCFEINETPSYDKVQLDIFVSLAPPMFHFYG